MICSGDYCPLAAEATEPAPPPSLKPSRSLAPRCPAGFYCPSASILSPRQCSFHVSTLNDLFNASLNPQELCLEGSSYPSLCTAGFYCPNSTAAVCPSAIRAYLHASRFVLCAVTPCYLCGVYLHQYLLFYALICL